MVHPSTGQLTPRKHSRRRVTLLDPLVPLPGDSKNAAPSRVATDQSLVSSSPDRRRTAHSQTQARPKTKTRRPNLSGPRSSQQTTGARAAWWCLLRSRTTKPHPRPVLPPPATSLHQAPAPSFPLASSAAFASPPAAARSFPAAPGSDSATGAGARVSGAGRRGMSSSRRPAGSRVPTTPLTDGGW